MKKSIAYAVSKGLVLAVLSQAALADGVEYEIQWDESDRRYHVYMRPDATPLIDRTMTAQVTLRTPHGMFPAESPSPFTNLSIGFANASDAVWSVSSGAVAPIEDPTVDYISFSLSAPFAYGMVAGVQQELFSFDSGACFGAVEIMDNANDPFNNPTPPDTTNSARTNPGNQFAQLSWGTPADNDFLGVEGSAAVCQANSGNSDPVANNDSATVVQDGEVAINVLGNDTDADNDNLTISAKTDGADGVVTLVNDSSVTYTPDAGYVGSDSFTYTITDGEGGNSTATVSMTVTEKQSTNSSPVAVNDSASVLAGSSVDIDVLDNDFDTDSDTLTLTAVGSAANGTTSINNGQVRYAADSAFSGSDTFTYTVSDGKNGEATGTVTVTANVATASDDDGDGLSNDEEAALNTDPDLADSDGDGISDRDEVGGNVSSPVDTDNDGTIDALDDDDDNDNILTRFENYNGSTPVGNDTDRDGTPDYLDPDDDNDGLLTAQESPDPNGDGDPADAADVNNDGVADYLQRPGNFSPESQKAIPTLTQWAQILLSMLLGLVALGGFWRKNN